MTMYIEEDEYTKQETTVQDKTNVRGEVSNDDPLFGFQMIIDFSSPNSLQAGPWMGLCLIGSWQGTGFELRA